MGHGHHKSNGDEKWNNFWFERSLLISIPNLIQNHHINFFNKILIAH